MGLRLGLSQEDLDKCAIEYPHEEQAHEMFRQWQEKQCLDDDIGKTKLAEVLKELGELEALSWCEKKKEDLQEAEKEAVMTPAQIEKRGELELERKQKPEKKMQVERQMIPGRKLKLLDRELEHLKMEMQTMQDHRLEHERTVRLLEDKWMLEQKKLILEQQKTTKQMHERLMTVEWEKKNKLIVPQTVR